MIQFGMALRNLYLSLLQTKDQKFMVPVCETVFVCTKITYPTKLSKDRKQYQSKKEIESVDFRFWVDSKQADELARFFCGLKVELEQMDAMIAEKTEEGAEAEKAPTTTTPDLPGIVPAAPEES